MDWSTNLCFKLRECVCFMACLACFKQNWSNYWVWIKPKNYKPVPELVERNIYRKQVFFSHVFIVKPVFPMNFPYHAMGFQRLPPRQNAFFARGSSVETWTSHEVRLKVRLQLVNPAWIFWENDGHIFQEYGPSWLANDRVARLF